MKLTPADRAQIHRLSRQGFSHAGLATRYDVSTHAITQIARGVWTSGTVADSNVRGVTA